MNLISAEYLESFSLGCQTNWDDVSLKMHDHENKSSETLKQYLKDAAYYSFKSDKLQSTEKLKNIESIAELYEHLVAESDKLIITDDGITIFELEVTIKKKLEKKVYISSRLS